MVLIHKRTKSSIDEDRMFLIADEHFMIFVICLNEEHHGNQGFDEIFQKNQRYVTIYVDLVVNFRNY